MPKEFGFDSDGRLLIAGVVLDVGAVPYTRDRATWKGKLHRTDLEPVLNKKGKFHRQKRRGKSARQGVNWRNDHQLNGDKFNRAMRIA